MNYAPQLLNKALALSLEWGEHYQQGIQERLKKKKASLTESQLNEIDDLCRRQVQPFAWRQFEAEADGVQTVREAKEKIIDAFPWIDPDNLGWLTSQGQYYARK